MISEHTFLPRKLGAIAFFEGKEVVDNPFCPLEIELDVGSKVMQMRFHL